MIRFVYLVSIIHSIFHFNGVSAFPTAAGHCDTGDLSSQSSPHGQNGGGPLSNGSLQLKIGSSQMSTFLPNTLEPNTQYTVTLDFSTSNLNFFYRGFLIRLSSGSENVEGTLFVDNLNGDPNVQEKSNCDSGVSAMTHRNNENKRSVSFDFEYTKTAPVALLLEVTVMREKAPDNWFYSSYNIDIEEADSPIASPSTSPIWSPSESPSQVISSSPSGAVSSCEDSTYKFKTKRPSDDKRMYKYCKFVKKNPAEYCNWKSASDFCPDTCDTCEPCRDAGSKFKFYKKPTDETLSAKNCRWTGKNPNRCQIEDMALTCRDTCGVC